MASSALGTENLGDEVPRGRSDTGSRAPSDTVVGLTEERRASALGLSLLGLVSPDRPSRSALPCRSRVELVPHETSPGFFECVRRILMGREA